jgi:hypothetical protein
VAIHENGRHVSKGDSLEINIKYQRLEVVVRSLLSLLCAQAHPQMQVVEEDEKRTGRFVAWQICRSTDAGPGRPEERGVGGRASDAGL